MVQRQAYFGLKLADLVIRSVGVGCSLVRLRKHKSRERLPPRPYLQDNGRQGDRQKVAVQVSHLLQRYSIK